MTVREQWFPDLELGQGPYEASQLNLERVLRSWHAALNFGPLPGAYDTIHLNHTGTVAASVRRDGVYWPAPLTVVAVSARCHGGQLTLMIQVGGSNFLNSNLATSGGTAIVQGPENLVNDGRIDAENYTLPVTIDVDVVSLDSGTPRDLHVTLFCRDLGAIPT